MITKQQTLFALVAITSLSLLVGCKSSLGHGVGLGATLAPAGCTNGTDVVTTLGPVCGTQATVDAKPLDIYQGIPYAATTGGANRWKPPQETSWTQTFPATSFGKKCAQPGLLGPVGAEDCLSINVWAPHGGKNLPVMLFIYGGGFIQGSNRGKLLDGERLAASEDVIVVNFNYRLGSLGFLAVNVHGDTNPNWTGNFGLLDQQRAMRWVKNNIVKFGGDAGNVTLFGESAGAMSVGLHLFSVPASTDLFEAAIMESNPIGLPYKTKSEAESFGTKFVQDAGCKSGANRKKCLLEKTLSEVFAAQKKAGKPKLDVLALDNLLVFDPYIDEVVLTSQPVAALASARYTLAKPLILGTNRNEGILFSTLFNDGLVMADKPHQRQLWNGVYRTVVKTLFPQHEAEILALYPQSSKSIFNPKGQAEDNIPTMGKLINDFMFACANRYTATEAVKKAQSGVGVYAYEFTQQSTFNIWAALVPVCATEVCHGAELPYVFDTPPKSFTTAENKTSELMMAYWGGFGHSGHNPNGAGAAFTWPDFSQKEYVVIDQPPSTMSSAVFDQTHNCSALWDGIGYDTVKASISESVLNQIEAPPERRGD